MESLELIKQIIATYRLHGWELRRVLWRSELRASLNNQTELFGPASLIDADFDAFWFARPSPSGREAWELRLLAEQPYALFEAFEADENEDEREEARREMEARMRDRLLK